jgi:hypothetical protein
MRAERAKLKSCKDDMIIARGKRSAALGYGRKMILSFLPSGFARPVAQNRKGRKRLVGWALYPGGGLGYYLAAPSGRRTGELVAWKN